MVTRRLQVTGGLVSSTPAGHTFNLLCLVTKNEGPESDKRSHQGEIEPIPDYGSPPKRSEA